LTDTFWVYIFISYPTKSFMADLFTAKAAKRDAAAKVTNKKQIALGLDSILNSNQLEYYMTNISTTSTDTKGWKSYAPLLNPSKKADIVQIWIWQSHHWWHGTAFKVGWMTWPRTQCQQMTKPHSTMPTSRILFNRCTRGINYAYFLYQLSISLQQSSLWTIYWCWLLCNEVLYKGSWYQKDKTYADQEHKILQETHFLTIQWPSPIYSRLCLNNFWASEVQHQEGHYNSVLIRWSCVP